MVLLALALAGCSGSSDPEAAGSGPSGSSAPSAEPSNYLKVPKGVTLTPQGSQLRIGTKATVAWAVTAKKITALDLTVTDVQKVSLKQLKAWKLDAATKKSTPYFVNVKVGNVGKGDAGGTTIPLYLVDKKELYVSASTFQSDFKACPSTPLPKKFKNGSKAKLCLVYLAPDGGKVDRISFWPAPGFDPVSWKGRAAKG